MGAKCLCHACSYRELDQQDEEDGEGEERPNEETAIPAPPCSTKMLPSIAEVVRVAPANDYTAWAEGKPTQTSQILSESTVGALCCSHGHPTSVEKQRMITKLENPLNFLVTTVAAAESYQISQQALCQCIMAANELKSNQEKLGKCRHPWSVVETINMDTCLRAKYAAETILRSYPDLKFFEPVDRSDISGLALIDGWVRVIEFISRF